MVGGSVTGPAPARKGVDYRIEHTQLSISCQHDGVSVCEPDVMEAVGAVDEEVDTDSAKGEIQNDGESRESMMLQTWVR